jgi:ribosomal protein S18 acetylase RimI-like enzyme
MSTEEITFTHTLDGVGWAALKAALAADDFDNGRTPEQLQASFANSAHFCFARAGERIIGKARILSDGVCNAYMVDVWTHSDYRNRGIAREMIRRLKERLPGQHIYLQADEENLEFYARLGFRPQPHGLFLIVGTWLDNASE